MRLSARVQPLERQIVLAAGSADAQARQAWLREQRLRKDGDRLAAVNAILKQADLRMYPHRDPAWREAVSVFLSQLSDAELRALAADAKPRLTSAPPGTSVRSRRS